MAKSKSKGLNIANLLAIVLGVIAIILFGILPMVEYSYTDPIFNSESVVVFKGFSMIFGGEVSADTTLTIGSKVTSDTATVDVAFNTMAFVSFLLVVIGLLLTLVSTFAKSISKNKVVTFLAGALIIIGGILMFTIKNSTVTAVDSVDAIEYFKLAIGPIIAGIVSILSGAIVMFPALKK